MMQLNTLRNNDAKILALGSHKQIIQSMLDFDYLSNKQSASIKAIIATGRKFERFFFGKKEILIPVYDSLEKLPLQLKNEITLFYNTTSARRVKQSTLEALTQLPNVLGGVIFAEDLPEKHALEMNEHINSKDKFLIGPASVGLIIPKYLKIGAIGGTDFRQLIASDVFTSGNVAVLSASGGMVGEIIRSVTMQGKRLSFSLSFGGDRFPLLTPKEAFQIAQDDPHTETIVYYGELGGNDEYELAELLERTLVTKKVICYIAGTVSELFTTPPQFGHAKAMAKSKGESAREKREALKNAGAIVAETFAEFIQAIKELPNQTLQDQSKLHKMVEDMNDRKPALLTTSISDDQNGDASILGENLLSFVQNRSFATIVASMLLGRNKVSKELEQFTDLVLRLAVDHGPYVSGAINTIITARAGRDLVSSLSAGLLTIGQRFGGAVNQAAINWLTGVLSGKSTYDFVEDFASKKIYIQGIGHKKYRVDFPDPRVTELLKHTENLTNKRFTNFALEVQKITTAKKGNLILNVDGSIAAVLLDILSEKEGYSDEELKRLTEIEFFNALFVLSRSVGFISHYLDQKRLDEGLFRLPEDLVTNANLES